MCLCSATSTYLSRANAQSRWSMQQWWYCGSQSSHCMAGSQALCKCHNAPRSTDVIGVLRCSSWRQNCSQASSTISVTSSSKSATKEERQARRQWQGLTLAFAIRIAPSIGGDQNTRGGVGQQTGRKEGGFKRFAQDARPSAPQAAPSPPAPIRRNGCGSGSASCGAPKKVGSSTSPAR